MPYANRKDGQGWRAVSGPNDVGPDEDFSDTIPAQSAALVKATKWEAIKAERDRRTAQGGYKVGTKWFHSDQKSRGQQVGLNLLALKVLSEGGNLTTPLPGITPWKTMDGTEVVVTVGLAQQILAAGAAGESAIFDAAKIHKSAMEASADPASYDFSGDWPKVFGE